jgi:hypothetical protein
MQVSGAILAASLRAEPRVGFECFERSTRIPRFIVQFSSSDGYILLAPARRANLRVLAMREPHWRSALLRIGRVSGKKSQ